MSKKTIRELADEIGVSKTAISNKVTQSQKRKWFAKDGNRFVINEKGQEAIKAMFPEGNHLKTKSKTQSNSPTALRFINRIPKDYLVYKDQLSEKDKQIESLQKLLKDHQKLLDQQQQLTLQANQQIQRLQLETMNKTEELSDQTIPTSIKNEEIKSDLLPVKKGFFRRLFGNMPPNNNRSF